MEWMLSQKEDKVTAVMKRKKTVESQVKFVKKKKDWKRKRTKVSHRRKRKQCVIFQNCAQMILYHQNNRPKLWSKIRNKIKEQKLKKRKRKQKKRQKKRKKKLKD